MDVFKLGNIPISIPPERKIDFTGMRVMVKYDVPGDRPRYQDMGRDERTVKWNGIFYGTVLGEDGKERSAYEQAVALQEYYDSGKNVDDGTQNSGLLFLFEDISCRVLIKNYSYQYFRNDKIRYEIELVRLESDFDKKDTKATAKTNKVEPAKNALEKLKDDINKAMKIVNDVSKAAQKVQKTLYDARKSYLAAINTIVSPIRNMKQQIQNVKSAFDKTLATVNYSIGSTSTPANKQVLTQALKNMQATIPLAQSMLLLAQQRSLGQRLDEVISQLTTRQIKQGDTLRSIATDVLGDPHQWIVLAQINRLSSSIIPATIKEIKIPNSSNLSEIQKMIDEQVAQLPKAASNYLPINLR